MAAVVAVAVVGLGPDFLPGRSVAAPPLVPPLAGVLWPLIVEDRCTFNAFVLSLQQLRE